jgi:leader peptidase (prepilin peptidase)/N-methyltransferase
MGTRFPVRLDAVAGTVLLGCAGLAAGWLVRSVLARLRRGARVRAGPCELGVAMLWVVSGWPGAWTPVLLGLGWLTVALTATDLVHHRLPDALTLPAAPVAVLLLVPAGGQVALRAALGAGLLVAAHAAVHLAAPVALGAGDVKLAGAVGAVLGGVSWFALLLGPVVAALLTAAVAVAGLLAGRLGRSDPLPHGPAMLVSTWVLAVLAHGA